MSEYEFITDPIVRHAMERFERCKRWESDARKRFLDDLRFAIGDSDNMWQWPTQVKQNRDLEERPCLTINKVRQHNKLIENEAKQNKPGIKIIPVGNGATYESAQIFSAIIRGIEAQSNAGTAYDTALKFMVNAGIGYIRVLTEFEADNSFDTAIRIRRIIDPLSVYLDPDAVEADKSDGRFGFIFTEYSEEEFHKLYPEVGDPPHGALESEWYADGKIRIAEYFYQTEEKDTLYLTALGTTMFKSEAPEGFVAPKGMKKREVLRKKVKWAKIAGHKVIEEQDFPCQFIPIIPMAAEEHVVEGQMFRSSHTTYLKDPQRIYNYWSSSAVEYGALQTKTPWLVAAESVEEYQELYESANRKNHAYLPYNAYTDDGQPLAPPQKLPPPVSSPVALQGMQVARDEMSLVSGQYAPSFGEQGPERTGEAINARNRQGDKATYHYVEAQATAVRHVGVILIDMIPKVYDTKRVIRAIGDDKKDYELTIDPRASAVFESKLDHQNEVIARVLNPTLGRYEVEVDVGPGYATRRQEAFNAMTLILTQAPQLAQIIGDLMFLAGDFPMADEAAARLKRMVPPQALGEGPTQNETMLQQQMAQVAEELKKVTFELEMTRLKVHDHSNNATIAAYKALTERIKVLASQDMDEHTRKVEVQKLALDAAQITLGAMKDGRETSHASGD